MICSCSEAFFVQISEKHVSPRLGYFTDDDEAKKKSSKENEEKKKDRKEVKKYGQKEQTQTPLNTFKPFLPLEINEEKNTLIHRTQEHLFDKTSNVWNKNSHNFAQNPIQSLQG